MAIGSKSISGLRKALVESPITPIIASSSSILSDISSSSNSGYAVKTRLLDMSGDKYFVMPFILRNALYSKFAGMEDLFNHRSLTSDENKAESDAERKVIERTFAVPILKVAQIIDAIDNALIRASDSDDLNFVEDFQVSEELKFVLSEVQTHTEEVLLKFKNPENNSVTFEEILFLLNRKSLVIKTTYRGVSLAFETLKANLCSSFLGPYIKARGSVITNGGDGIVKTPVSFEFSVFDDTLPISELEFSLVPPETETYKNFVELGKTSIHLMEKPVHKKYTGTQFRRSYNRNNGYRANGRCMIDIVSMRQMDPDYNTYLGIDTYEDNATGSPVSLANLKDSDFVIVSPFVYGFSFATKKWGEFLAKDMTEIEFRDTAFDNLVLDQEKKSILYSLVDSVNEGASDLIDGKSMGTILLLAGPSGSGKTLTAESIAERLHRPLYMVGVGELGTTVKALEANLSDILNTAAAWNAILLIDEADIFMEERSDMDVERNAMVGIFLRLLEYYEGVLFLTTNRANNIDKAFFSRISLSLYYNALDVQDRKTVWGNLAGMNQIRLNSTELEHLSQYDLNGREIKNVLKLSSALAIRDNKAVRMPDMVKVIEQGFDFKEHVNVKKTLWGRFVQFINALILKQTS